MAPLLAVLLAIVVGFNHKGHPLIKWIAGLGGADGGRQGNEKEKLVQWDSEVRAGLSGTGTTATHEAVRQSDHSSPVVCRGDL